MVGWEELFIAAVIGAILEIVFERMISQRKVVWHILIARASDLEE